VRPTGLLRVALLALIWGSGFLWIKISLRGFTPTQLTFARLALGALVLVAILRLTHRPLPGGRRLWGHLAMAALLGNAIPYLLFGVAERTVTSNLAGAINATTPLWTVLFAILTRTEKRPTAYQGAGILAGFVGALVMLAPWNSTSQNLTGAAACLVASASYGASYVYMGRYLTGRDLPPLALSAGQLIAATGLLVLATPYGGLETPYWRPDATFALLILGTIGTGIAYLLNYRIISDDGPILASTVTYLLPVVAVILGVTILNEDVNTRTLAGITLVLIGVGLTRRRPGHHQPSSVAHGTSSDRTP
jgi:drug/metabolite transporter (DMT)-like permease